MVRVMPKKLVLLQTGMVACLAQVFLTLIMAQAMAAEPYQLKLRTEINAGELHIPIGKSQILRSPQSLKQIIVGDPNIADVKLLSEREVLVLGKSPGTTNLAFRDQKKQVIALVDVVVGYDLLAIKRKIHELLPQEERIEVRSANDTVILSGEASSASAMDTAVSIAGSYVPDKGKIINHLQVGGGQQVMLEVTIAEISRTAARNLGVAAIIREGKFSLTPSATTAAIFGTVGLVPAILDNFNITLTAMEGQNLAKILAEPKIAALSGHEASFLSGGQFPYQVVDGDGNPSTEFKEFGVGVKFTPTVLRSDKIGLLISTEVSDITAFPGSDEPGITIRRTSTTVEQGDGESFMIAGLLSNNMDNAIDKFPGLGSLPVLGTLFRSTEFQRNETELVIAITPHLVKPVSAGTLAFPTDGLVPPSEVDQYWGGRLEESAGGFGGKETGIEGPRGHQL